MSTLGLGPIAVFVLAAVFTLLVTRLGLHEDRDDAKGENNKDSKHLTPASEHWP